MALDLMKQTLITAITAFTLLVTHHVNAMSFAFPGTGLSVDVPPDLRPTPVGSALIDESGETIILFSGGASQTDLETDPTWRALYRNPPERIKTDFIEGNLYKRTRQNDGGKWDGWFLAVHRGNKSFIVMASYTGTSQEKFERIRKQLTTIRWNDKHIEAEKAMGVQLAPNGLKAVPDVFGALSYNTEGRIGGSGPNILVQLMPIPPAQAPAIVPSGCATVLGNAFAGVPYEGPKIDTSEGFQRCEAWSNQTSKEIRYASLVRTPNNGLLMIVGTSTAEQFKDFLPKIRQATQKIVFLRGK
jgi:hypothetical protein